MEEPVAEEQAASEHTASDEDEKAKQKRAKALANKVRYPKVDIKWYRSRDQVMSFDDLDFDLEGVHGQARPFSKDILDTRLKEMREALPTGLLKICVWPIDIHGVLAI